ncbi:hypothetical protein [Armatimonas rosea]|uniref:Uncharacterized protein n=1 Tax=Armatimonas rosea TaxID=685828 RepID=A0A7W9W5C5_ARMRO|nr:hypothetical protein [Armatimonas rosea]MBB6048422.1 hypothetical protein [Armatimonas rosea]
MSYARARLWLGITGVGTLVTLAALLLLFQFPQRFLLTEPAAFFTELQQLFFVFVGYVALSAPFDFFGGYVLPHEFGRSQESFARFFPRWLRGVVLHSGLLLGFGLLLLHAARVGGTLLALGAFCGLQLALLLLQPLLAQGIGGLRSHGAASASGGGHYFTGGITGLPGRERVLIPQHWEETLTPEQLQVVLLRRRGAVQTGARTRGLLLAFGWNLAGFSLALALAGGLGAVSQLVTVSLGSTLWSFLGVLLLPAPSQRGVIEADQYALKNGASREVLESVIRQLDTLQDDEPARSERVERIFHPLPSVRRRLQHLDSPSTGYGAWHGARMALYFSWAGLGLLSRAVHCNAGRPDVWVFLPSD